MRFFSLESSTASVDQLKENNGKLRLAIQILNDKYENEQIFHLEQIERYKLALERIPELQQKIKELDEKKQILSLKEQEVSITFYIYFHIINIYIYLCIYRSKN